LLQNKFFRANQFSSKSHPTYLFYSNAKILKLEDMINAEFAKFMFNAIIKCYQIRLIIIF